MREREPKQDQAQQYTAVDAACDRGHQRRRYAYNAGAKTDQQSRRPNGDIETGRKLRHHSGRQQDAETNDKVAERQGSDGELSAGHSASSQLNGAERRRRLQQSRLPHGAASKASFVDDLKAPPSRATIFCPEWHGRHLTRAPTASGARAT